MAPSSTTASPTSPPRAEPDPSRGGGTNGAPFVIGVTGNIAVGKSAVLGELADLGAETIDADVVYHELISHGRPLWRAIRDRFGERVVGSNGEIDRAALARLVFADSGALARLDALTHPAVVEEIERRIAQSGAGIVAIDAVKLIESGLDRACDVVWIVVASPEQQIERLMGRSGMCRADAARRVAAQPAVEPKLARADEVIDNSGSIERTKAYVRAAWVRTLRRRQGTANTPRTGPDGLASSATGGEPT